jgi:hypothetical protein
VIEQLLTQQQQQQQQRRQQASLEQRYCLIRLAEGLLLLMDVVWIFWAGKRLVGKTLAPAVLPTIKLSLALLEMCGSSGSSSSSRSTGSSTTPGSCSSITWEELNFLEVQALDLCCIWCRDVRIGFNGFQAPPATEVASSSSSSLQELLGSPALLQLVLLHLAVTTWDLHDRRKGLSPLLMPATAAAQPEQQQQQARRKVPLQVEPSHTALLATLRLSNYQRVSGRHRKYSAQLIAPAAAAAQACELAALLVDKYIIALVAQGNTGSSSSSGNLQPLLPAQQVMPLLQTLVQLQLLAPELRLLSSACEVMWRLCSLCTCFTAVMSRQEFREQTALPLLQQCVLSLGPAVLSALKQDEADAEQEGKTVVARRAPMQQQQQQALEWFGKLVGVLLDAALRGCK